jgi:hypothetical protein
VTKGRAGVGIVTCAKCGARSTDITRFTRAPSGLVCRDEPACRRREEAAEK